jgi:hypothetical protein
MNRERATSPSQRLFPAALAGILLLLTVSSLIAAPRRPPSSLHRAGAVVRFTHSAERVVGCKMQAASTACAEQRVPGSAGADFVLTPAADQLVSEPEAARQPVNVSLPTQPATSTLETRVESGNWSLSWADQHVTLHVDAQRDFSVRLKTIAGACVAEQDQCRRHDDVVSRSVLVPPEFLGAR